MHPPFQIYNTTSRDILRELIYFSSGFVLPREGVEFGRPVPMQPLCGDPLRCDTVIDITMQPTWHGGHRICGSKAFWYRRFDLAALVPLHAHRSPPPISGYPVDTWTMLPAINEYYGLRLAQDDVENRVIVPAETAYLVASHTSLAFSGRVELRLGLPDIASLVDTTSIGEFEADR